MEIKFTFEEKEIQKVVRRFAREDILPIRKEVDRQGDLPEGIKERFIEMGFLRSPFPEAYGGVDGTFTGLVIALKELSYGSMIPAWMLFENFMLAYPLLRYGSEFLKDTYLPGLISLETIGALAFTEADTGSDPTQLKTVAERVKGGWLINGSKRFITNSGICNHMILFARTGNDVTAFVVQSDKEGYKPGKRETFIHSAAFDNGDLYLEDYFAPDDHVIGEVGQGFEILLQTEAVGKIAFSAFFIGLAERALDLAVQYANTRTHRGKPIGGKFQMTQWKIARMMVRIEAMNAYLFHVCARVDRGKEIFTEAALLKLMVAEEVKAVILDAMEIHGAYGLSQEYEVADLYRTAIGAQVIMGSLDIQRVIIARGILGKAHYSHHS